MLENKLKVLQQRLTAMEANREEIERTNRLNNVVVHGIPIRAKNGPEPPSEILRLIQTGFNIDLEGKINTCYRLRPGPRQDQIGVAILLKFTHPVFKAEFLNHVMNNPRTMMDFGGLSRHPVTASEHLTPHRAILLREASAFSRKGRLQVWVLNGRLYVRKGNDSIGFEPRTVQEIRDLANQEGPGIPTTTLIPDDGAPIDLYD